MLDVIGGRKVAATLLTLTIGCTITWFKGDVPANMLQLLEVVFAAFVAGNGIEHVARSMTGTPVASDTPAPAVPATETPATIQPVDFTPVLTQLGTMQEAIANSQQGISLLVQYVHGSVTQQQQK